MTQSPALNFTRRLAPWALALSLAACGGGGGGISGTGAQMGTLRLALTDAPACGFDEVNVTIEKVRVHQNASVNDDSDAGWIDLPLTEAKRIDLLTLTNGVLEELGETTLPAGKYTQLRLVLAANQGAPWANSVVPTSGAETALDTPSGVQSGLKLNVDIDVEAGQRADFVLDFDACKSVVTAGASGKYNLKPVLTVIPRLSDAGMRVIGYVDPAIASGTTTISLQSNGVVVKATPPITADGADKGQFVLYPVPAGSYDLVVTASGRVTAVMTGVPVVNDAYTYVNGSTTRIDPPASARHATVSGRITGADDGAVRAVQSLAGGTAVEVAWAAADAATGDYSLSLPTDAPVQTAWAENPAALDFTADDSAAGLYTLTATSGETEKSADVDVGGGDLADQDFSFP